MTFHRAFDQLRDPLVAIDDARCGRAQIDRILTSGGEGPPAVRAERLRAYQERAGSRLTIIAGGGVDEEMLSCARPERVGAGSARRPRARVGDSAAECRPRAVARLRTLLESTSR